MSFRFILPLAVMRRLHARAEVLGFFSEDGRPDLDALLTQAVEESAAAHQREACWRDLQAVCQGDDTDLVVLARAVSAAIHDRSDVPWPIAGAHYAAAPMSRRAGAWHVTIDPSAASL